MELVTGIVIWIILIACAVLLLWAIINKKMSSSGNFAATSVLSDMQNQDKQKALETVIEDKAGKKRFAQESGDKEKLT